MDLKLVGTREKPKNANLRPLWDTINQLQEEIYPLQIKHNQAVPSITAIMDITVEHRIIIQRIEAELISLYQQVEKIHSILVHGPTKPTLSSIQRPTVAQLLPDLNAIASTNQNEKKTERWPF